MFVHTDIVLAKRDDGRRHSSGGIHLQFFSELFGYPVDHAVDKTCIPEKDAGSHAIGSGDT